MTWISACCWGVGGLRVRGLGLTAPNSGFSAQGEGLNPREGPIVLRDLNPEGSVGFRV